MQIFQRFFFFRRRKRDPLGRSTWAKSSSYQQGASDGLSQEFSSGRFGKDCAIPPFVQNLQKSVWIIDDDEDVRASISEMLGRHGYKVSAFECGENLPQRISSAAEPPSLLLLDLRMPRIDGLEVLAELES